MPKPDLPRHRVSRREYASIFLDPPLFMISGLCCARVRVEEWSSEKKS
ncbi:hypothetical protein M6B38_389080 [Iris pallida]|uniref:Uncharacterized protein n=1 Tax=Iris pallida TaxID=29817 RepID=A0AAX6EVR5_IRIPA|nr:hypothetical protein M6B38_171530 [Iris pallida]KAJ6813174.1 hypothetical protein M6B38_146920 [Iris pallida]KAJ6813891.1 hypothetical protein M6B38_143370 [Iris pallida]KAJ6822376.1 hypothetical protein M6B38_389075 [Iris pallida]KAJ6822377.1 hypothetical protein M6B38_389080 [Iris pallida]